MGAQLSLFDEAQPPESDKNPLETVVEHQLLVEPVPERLALEPGRVRIVIVKRIAFRRTSKNKKGQKIPEPQVIRFALAIQWTPQEAANLMYEIRGLTWQLDEEDKPPSLEAIFELCKMAANSTANNE